MWMGEEVQETLKIQIDKDDEKTFKNLCGLAYRNNPKRAHLIVSKVLGKHIPQKPSIIDNAAYILAIKINAVLGGKSSTFDVAQWSENFTKSAIRPLKNLPGKELLVFGYAETATNLGALVAEHLNCEYLHSTRYGDEAIKNYGNFDEEHSHAQSHKVKVKNKKMVNNGDKTIILVDDELTTGNTIMNTIKMFEKQCHHKNYIVATLTDLRSNQDIKNMKEFAKKHNLTIKVAALLATQIEIVENAKELAKNKIKELNNSPSEKEPDSNSNGVINIIKTNIPTTELYYGASPVKFKDIEENVKRLREKLPLNENDKILVLGNEEYMYTPFKLSQLIESEGYDVQYSTTTLSPVISYNRDDYAIKNCIKYNGNKYSYNLKDKHYQHIIMVSNSPEDTVDLKELFEELSKIANKVTIMEMENNK